jgi:hypothetical protein
MGKSSRKRTTIEWIVLAAFSGVSPFGSRLIHVFLPGRIGLFKVGSALDVLDGNWLDTD